MAIQKQPIINFAAQMDARTNNEILDIDPNSKGIELTYLSNGDLFFTKALTSRQGVLDICGGIVNASGVPSLAYNLLAGSISGTQYTKEPVFLADQSPERQGMIINFGTGSNFNITNGTIYLQDCFQNPSTAQEIGYDINIQIYLSQINTNGNAQPGSGVAFIDNGGYHSLALSGNFNVPFFQIYPQLLNATNVFQNYDVTPAAISDIITVNFGDVYTNGSGTAALPYGSPIITVPFEFSAPYPFMPDTPYYLKIVANNTSGTSARNIQAMVMSDGVDQVPNALYGNEFYQAAGNKSSIIRIYSNNPLPTGVKSWLQSTIYQEVKPNIILTENAGVNFTLTAPIAFAQPGYLPSSNNVTYQTNPTSSPFYLFNPNLTKLTVSTTGTPFGQIFTVPSGQHSINGAYIYANTFTGNSYRFFGANKLPLNTSNYSVNYVAGFSLITGTNGGFGLGFNTQLLTSYSGNWTFATPNTYQDKTHDTAVSGINSNLEKIYAIFPNPIEINNTGNQDYLLSWQFFDQTTGLPLSDYGTRQAGFNINGEKSEFCSPISIGMFNPQGTGTTDTFTYFNQNINAWDVWDGYSTKKLSAGLVSVPTGNAITSIYDYRVGDGRTQKVMYTQGADLSFFNLSDPTTRTTIYTGATAGDSFKWSHTTFQNLLFSQQYGISSGICWDQIYSNPSGNWTQTMGLRPSFSGNSALLNSTPSGTNISGGSYSTGIPSGSIFSVMLSTQILSGGLRASNIVGVSGSKGNSYEIFGAPSPFNQATTPYDIYHVSGLAASGITTVGQSQYNFDVDSNGTYVWATQNSGNVYYLAPLCDRSGNAYPNPMPNNNTWNSYAPFYSGNNASGSNSGPGVYIYDITFSGVNAQQVPNVVTYGQNYLLSQIDVPKLKKMIVYNNLVIGIGDPNNPSRLWYSQQQAPQIWGNVGDIDYGFYDIDNDNGQEITGIEIYKGYLIIFKENSTYSASYTSTAGNPLNIQNIDTNKGNLGIFSTVATSYGAFGLSQYGPVLATYYGVETIGDKILPYYQQLDHGDLIFSVAVHDVARQQIYWSITNSNISQDNQKGLVYSYADQAWGTRTNGMWNAAGTVGNTDNFAILMAGDTFGQIKQINSGVYLDDELFVDTNQTSLTSNINLQWETPWLNFLNSQDLKQMKSLRINCDESSQFLQVDVYYDQNENAPVYTRYLDMSQPAWNRVISLAGVCRTVKLVVNSTGSPDKVKINSMMLTYMNRGQNTNI